MVCIDGPWGAGYSSEEWDTDGKVITAEEFKTILTTIQNFNTSTGLVVVANVDPKNRSSFFKMLKDDMKAKVKEIVIYKERANYVSRVDWINSNDILLVAHLGDSFEVRGFDSNPLKRHTHFVIPANKPHDLNSTRKNPSTMFQIAQRLMPAGSKALVLCSGMAGDAMGLVQSGRFSRVVCMDICAKQSLEVVKIFRDFDSKPPPPPDIIALLKKKEEDEALVTQARLVGAAAAKKKAVLAAQKKAKEVAAAKKILEKNKKVRCPVDAQNVMWRVLGRRFCVLATALFECFCCFSVCHLLTCCFVCLFFACGLITVNCHRRILRRY